MPIGRWSVALLSVSPTLTNSKMSYLMPEACVTLVNAGTPDWGSVLHATNVHYRHMGLRAACFAGVGHQQPTGLHLNVQRPTRKFCYVHP